MRKVLGDLVGERSRRALDRKLGRSQNYVSRVIRGDVQKDSLAFQTVFEILEAAGIRPQDFFQEVARRIGAEPAVETPKEVDRTQQVVDRFLGQVDAEVAREVLRPMVQELVQETLRDREVE